jgi:hypothetical protein
MQWRRATQTSSRITPRHGPDGRCLRRSYDTWLGPGADPDRMLCSRSSNSAGDGSARKPAYHSGRTQGSGRNAADTSGCAVRSSCDVWMRCAGPYRASTSLGGGLRSRVQLYMCSRVSRLTVSGSVDTEGRPAVSGTVTDAMPPRAWCRSSAASMKARRRPASKSARLLRCASLFRSLRSAAPTALIVSETSESDLQTAHRKAFQRGASRDAGGGGSSRRSDGVRRHVSRMATAALLATSPASPFGSRASNWRRLDRSLRRADCF